MPRSSPSCAGDRPGEGLVALATGVVVGVVLGNLWVPTALWGGGALALVLAATGVALRRHPRGLAWWAAAGFLGGLAACSFAPRRPAGPAGRAVAVRFRGVVRDGWVEGQQGLRGRLALEEVTNGDRAIRCPREVTAWVGGTAQRGMLPAGGTLIEGAGELSYPSRWQLAPPVLRIKSPLLLTTGEGGSRVDHLRERGVRALLDAAGVDPARLRAAGLAAALCLGRTDWLSQGEVADLQRSGLAHLLAVSGMNVGLAAAMAWVAMVVAGVPPRTRRWLLIPVIVGFALLAGGQAPVRRAAVGAVAYLVARQFGRPLLPVQTVWGVVAGLLLIEPAAIMQASFQLSAGITLALVRWTGPVSAWLRALPRRVAQEIAVVVVAQLAAAPLVGVLFGAVPPLGLVANAAAAPLAGLLMAPAAAALLLVPLSAGVAGVCLAGLAGVQWALDALATAAGGVSWSFAPLGPLGVGVLVVLALLGLGVSRLAAPAALTAIALVATWLALPALTRPRLHEIDMLRVREGMAMLVRSGRAAILVDAGRVPGEAARELARLRVGRLDAVVVTHPDEDHVGGVATVLERVPTRVLLFAADEADHPAVVPLRRLARRRGADERVVRRGDRLGFGPVTGEVLWPPPGWSGGENDASLVVTFRVGGHRVMVTGDLEAGGERALVAAGGVPRADVLQVPHHGSRSSSTASFLAAVRPAVALVPTGIRPRSSYPHLEVAGRIHGVPAALLAQSSGFERIWWTGDDWLRVDAGDAVGVRGRWGND
ncbi:MAG: DNA internalization-related competence protein ComEC/Rec2 [Acidobacteriota bacterium]